MVHSTPPSNPLECSCDRSARGFYTSNKSGFSPQCWQAGGALIVWILICVIVIGGNLRRDAEAIILKEMADAYARSVSLFHAAYAVNYISQNVERQFTRQQMKTSAKIGGQSTFRNVRLATNAGPLEHGENRINDTDTQQSLLYAQGSEPSEPPPSYIVGLCLFPLSFGLGLYSAKRFEQCGLTRFKSGKRYLGLLLMSGLGLYCGAALIFFGAIF